ncbi:glucose-6-phosphate dehydrogenase [Aliikangiella sp. IMCC44359]|uniref:glucose-6-phosphate dehydrogenase n=1 Tax=Aliikangiella sp. IMCC44359 TaxID=3459125 RepID=UPI00403AF618
MQATDLVIFGGTGDLTLRKLMPALFRALNEKSISEKTVIYATCRNKKQAESYASKLKISLKKYLDNHEFTEERWNKFKKLVQPIVLDISDSSIGWQELKNQLRSQQQAQRIFYFAIAPTIFAKCCEQISAFQLNHPESRVVVEKPLGYNRKTANEINQKIAQYFDEKQTFRIDHYLGKETVQNLMALRFSNILFENMWDKNSIDHIQISISETVGLEGRADFYNDAGALRDMVQNHLLQLLCLIAMEPPNKLNSDNIRTEKLKVLQSLRKIDTDSIREETIRGQYVSGEENGKLVKGYLEELASTNSFCETFVAIKAHVENWRWAGVPFYLRTGKRLNARRAEIIIQFKSTSHHIFSPSQGEALPNKLIIQLQPEERIQLQLNSKDLAKSKTQLQPIFLDLNLTENFPTFYNDAYKRLLLDVFDNDPSLFIHRDEIDQAWAWIDPIIESWSKTNYQPELYRAGTWGPETADKLLKQSGRAWHNQ